MTPYEPERAIPGPVASAVDLADTSQTEGAVRRRRPVRLPPRVKVYLWLLVFTLPIDYFKPTGLLFREGGAKPTIPLMAAGTAWILWRHWPELLFRTYRPWRTIFLLCAATVVLSTFAFVVNVGLEISYWGGVRSPWGQFLSQGALFVLIAPILITHAWFFSKKEVHLPLLKMIPTATVLHLLFILMEAVGLLGPTRFPLTLFRGSYFVAGRKPSGLMTEPSYVGAFAAMYSLLLLLCMPKKRYRDRLLAGTCIVVAMVLGGKTLLPALLVGLIGYAYQVRARVFSWKGVVVAVCLMAVTLYTIVSFSVLNVQANLSSAMRLGSTLLALKAAAAGYGLLGIGFGQFHFIYRREFAPHFLLYSPEARVFFAGIADARVSTFDLPARYLIEEGVLGLVLFFALIRLAFRHGRAHDDLWYRCGAVLAGASLGFLLTQDAYFFPAFVCGAAILASRPVRA